MGTLLLKTLSQLIIIQILQEIQLLCSDLTHEGLVRFPFIVVERKSYSTGRTAKACFELDHFVLCSNHYKARAFELCVCIRASATRSKECPCRSDLICHDPVRYGGYGPRAVHLSPFYKSIINGKGPRDCNRLTLHRSHECSSPDELFGYNQNCLHDTSRGPVSLVKGQ